MLFAFGLHAQTNLQFNYATYGANNHSGEADLQVKSANYKVEDNSIVFEFNIIDDEVKLDPDNLNTDHIEFWFSANEHANRLFKLKQKDDEEAYDEENDEYSYYENEWFELGNYDKRISEEDLIDQFRQDYFWQFSERTDDPDSSIFTAEVYDKYDMAGTSHWGIYADTSILFDREQYVTIEAPSKASEVNYTYTLTHDGYQLKVAFSPEQLIFVPSHLFYHIRLNVVIFDQDTKGLALHTLTQNYTWGNPRELNSYFLGAPLTIDVEEAVSDYTEFTYCYDCFYYFRNGVWQLYQKYSDLEDWGDNLYQVDYFPLGFSRKEAQIGPNKVWVYSNADDEAFYLYFPNEKANKQKQAIDISMGMYDFGSFSNFDFKIPDSLKLYPFKDGSVGFVMPSEYPHNTYGRGPCGACYHLVLIFYHISDAGLQRLLAVDHLDGNLVTHWSHELDIDDNWIPQFDQITWDMEKEQLTIPCIETDDAYAPDVPFVFAWDENWKPYLVKPE